MIIDLIDDEHYLSGVQKKIITNVIEAAGRHLNLSTSVELDVSIVSNDEIQQLNATYRNIDKPTDVLSFALDEDEDEFEAFLLEDQDGLTDEDSEPLARHLGDIIISFPKAQEQATDYEHSLERELAFLAVHGFLHLNGYDHQTTEEEKEMFAIQEEVLEAYGLTR